MESNQCSNCGLINIAGDTRCQRCNDLLPQLNQTNSWTKVAPPPTHHWMSDSTPPQPVTPLVTNPNLFPCPDCGRSCSTSAPSCPQCGRPFSARHTQPQAYPPPPPINPQQPQQIHYHLPYPYPAQQVWSPAVAAILSLFIPGVGQMYKGRIGEGILWLIFTPIGYIFLILPGLILHIICIINATQGNPHKQGG
jgi:TM2 domain-containing membrane protein YozV